MVDATGRTGRTSKANLGTATTVTDGGLETDLIFGHGMDLPHFAAFPLLDTAAGCQVLHDYYRDYADIARITGAALLLETPTWRANPDWGARVGYTRSGLSRINQLAVRMLQQWADDFGVPDTRVGGTIGPRGDGYRADLDDARADPDYHRDQLTAFAAAGANLVTAYTMTHVAEPIAIVRLARELELPVAISFTVELDGRLPSGQPLDEAIDELDTVAPPDRVLLNCAHPRHIAAALDRTTTWAGRITGLRYNASPLSHAELDEADHLEAGDPAALSADHDQLAPAFGHLEVLGGCCGTDARHVAALWHTSLAD